MLGVTVQGGTGAGRKRPLRQAHRENWRCPGCHRVNAAYATRCLTAGCQTRRNP